MTDQDLHTIELNLNEANKAVEIRLAIKRLQDNKDFVLVVNEAYLRDEALRLVYLKSGEGLNQEAIEEGIKSVAYLRAFLGTQMQLGQLAEKSIEDLEATREELVLEEAAE